MLLNDLIQYIDWHKYIKSLRQFPQIPLNNLRLPPITISLMLISSITDIIFGEIINKAKWPIINSNIDHTHIISIEDTMYKTNTLPITY